MKWLEQYATGVERLDNQHKMLFRMSEDYRIALDEGKGERMYGVLLQSLDGYARGHFQDEDQCMERYRCPVAKNNRTAHAEFIMALAGFQKSYAAGGFLLADAQHLVQYVDDWLTNHIGRIDARLKPCVEASEP